ncbi:hypothetical protein [Methyloglobulus sp.]|uniref:hypothetical protein n=1 Tax=Methyloglobulus sp. TaxID=2518622 RepID=UPI0039897EC2
MKSVYGLFSLRNTAPRVMLAVLTLLLPFNATALEWHNGDWQLHGFLSQGFTYTDHNQVFGTSQDVSLDYREMGVNASVKLLPNLLISAQGLYRDTGASDALGVRLDFAQVDYSAPLLDSSLVLGVRGGRVKVPFGLYNDSRDMVWTRPTVLLPQSVYFDTLGLRQAMISADGGVLYGRYTHGEHRLNLEFMTAQPQDNVGGAPAFLTGMPNAQGKLDGRAMFIGRALYEWMGGRGRLMFSVVDLDRDFSSTSPTSPSGNIQATYPLFSGQYNAERWSLTSEYGWIDSKRSDFFPVTLKNTTESFYVQGEYRFKQDITGVLRYDVFHVSREDRDGKALSQLTGLPRHRFYARDLTVGARWEFARNFLLAADYHYVNGTAWLNAKDNPDLMNGGGDPNWSLFTMMLSFRF